MGVAHAFYDFFSKNKGRFPLKLWDEVLNNLKVLEEVTGKKFGDRENPLLISVRPGFRSYFPINHQTILNLGLNDKISNGQLLDTCYESSDTMLDIAITPNNLSGTDLKIA